MYVIWTGIHSAADIGKSRKSDNDPETDDDAIYSSVNWNQRPTSAFIICLTLLFVVNPLVILFTWYLSTLLAHRYMVYDEGKENGDGVEAPESPDTSGGVDVEQPTEVDADAVESVESTCYLLHVVSLHSTFSSLHEVRRGKRKR